MTFLVICPLPLAAVVSTPTAPHFYPDFHTTIHYYAGKNCMLQALLNGKAPVYIDSHLVAVLPFVTRVLSSALRGVYVVPFYNLFPLETFWNILPLHRIAPALHHSLLLNTAYDATGRVCFLTLLM